MGYSAKVVADSVAVRTGIRLTTLEVTFPRIVLAEFNTHRTLCLAGDSVLEFDLPAGSRGSKRRVWPMRIDEFVDKWIGGARRQGTNPKRAADTSWVEPDQWYTVPHIAARLGMANPSNINGMCRRGELPARRGDDGWTWTVQGKDILSWRSSRPENARFDMRARLASMKIRQLNETTGDIQWSRVVAAMRSGRKEVFEVTAGDYHVAGSADHRVLTTDGWARIADLRPGDPIIVRRFGKHSDERMDPMRLKKIGGVWRSAWQRDERARLVAEDPRCRRCGVAPGVTIHHLEPVYRNPARAFDRDNITLLCDPCHNSAHAQQDWQGGTYLYGASVPVEAIHSRGDEETYDLEVAGEFPNFLANGVVVHNSRNSASSRAIPVEKRIAAIEADPFVPEAFGKNQRGMQAAEDLAGLASLDAQDVWYAAMRDAVHHARRLAELGVHKQLANRLVEPFAWQTVVVTATEWSNFFAQRCHPDAQPEIRRAAAMMRDAMAASYPVALSSLEWHTPYVEPGEAFDLQVLGMTEVDVAMVSAGRCARVSTLTHDGRRDAATDLALARKLRDAFHMSPFEHPATPLDDVDMDDEAWRFLGNVRGWRQLRKTFLDEDDFGRVLAARGAR